MLQYGMIQYATRLDCLDTQIRNFFTHGSSLKNRSIARNFQRWSSILSQLSCNLSPGSPRTALEHTRQRELLNGLAQEFTNPSSDQFQRMNGQSPPLYNQFVAWSMGRFRIRGITQAEKTGIEKKPSISVLSARPVNSLAPPTDIPASSIGSTIE